MSARIACSPLTGRIHRGRVNAAGNAFVGQKEDVTSDVLRAVVEKAQFHGGRFEIEGGGEMWAVTVTKQATGARTEDTAPAAGERANAGHQGPTRSGGPAA